MDQKKEVPQERATAQEQRKSQELSAILGHLQMLVGTPDPPNEQALWKIELPNYCIPK